MITGAHRQVSSDDLEPDDIVSSEAGRIKIRSVSKTSDQISVLGVQDPPGDKERRRKTSFKRGEVVTLTADEAYLDLIEQVVCDVLCGNSPRGEVDFNDDGDLRVALLGQEAAPRVEWLVALRPRHAALFAGRATLPDG